MIWIFLFMLYLGVVVSFPMNYYGGAPRLFFCDYNYFQTLSSHWVNFSFEKYLGLLSPPSPYLVSSKSRQDSYIASDRISLLKLIKSIFLSHSIKSATHQASALRNFIFLCTKYIPLQLTGILDFSWNHYRILINIQYSIASYVSYPPSTRTITRTVVNPRVPCSVTVKTFVGTGVYTCTGFRLDCESTDPCTTVETCGAYVVILWFTSSDSAPDADITCKVNGYKKVILPYCI